MDPNHNTGNAGPGLNNANLPPQPLAAGNELPVGLQPEQASTAAESAPAAPPPTPPITWLPPSVPVQPPTSQTAAVSQGTGAVDVPADADDGDLIEKEWVVKAKQIVDRTREDPHAQTKELHKFRAEYMKKRYNKVIEPVQE